MIVFIILLLVTVGRAHMSMASFSITSPRSTVIDYSSPYYYSGFTLLSITRESAEGRYFSFLAVFPTEIWLLIILSAFAIFICLVSELTNPLCALVLITIYYMCGK